MAQELVVPGTSGSSTKVRLKTGALFDGLCQVPGPLFQFAQQVPTLPLPQQKTGSSFSREDKHVSRLKGLTKHLAQWMKTQAKEKAPELSGEKTGYIQGIRNMNGITLPQGQWTRCWKLDDNTVVPSEFSRKWPVTSDSVPTLWIKCESEMFLLSKEEE